MAFSQDYLDQLDARIQRLALSKQSLSGDGLSAVEQDIEKLQRHREWVARQIEIEEGSGFASTPVVFGRGK